MTKVAIPSSILTELESFLKKNRGVDLITTYLFFLERKHKLDPVVFMREKRIYKSEDELIRILESEQKLWRETEIKIQLGKSAVNENTKKIYICPFSGKVFGDNTHPNPQDAIYDWVSQCPENTEKKDGLKVKKFYISEDLDVIKSYMKPTKQPLTKRVFSSLITGKLFHDKAGVIKDLKQNHLKHIPMKQVTSQNRFELQDDFLTFIQENLEETKISAFVESLSDHTQFSRYLEKWLEEDESNESDEEE